MVSRLLLPFTTLVALLCLSAPGVGACEKHLQSPSNTTANGTEAANR